MQRRWRPVYAHAFVDHDATIVTVFPDGPERYWNTVYDDDFCAEHGLLGVEAADEPDEIADPRATEVRRWTRCRKVIDPRQPTDAGPDHQL